MWEIVGNSREKTEGNLGKYVGEVRIKTREICRGK
jgi:hypothetical protein